MDLKIEESWRKALKNELEQPYFQKLADFVKQEYAEGQIFPPDKYIFHAFDKTPLPKVKAVIIGQDPYHGEGQANGLCFSVNDGVKQPPSLKNIFKELNTDLQLPKPESGNLENWAQQGVLLLNTTLTVRASKPGSHQKQGWEQFSDAVISLVSKERENVVFLLWGAFAQQKEILIDESKHLILKAAHPSPLSAYKGFLGCGHFSKTNAYLREKGKKEIDWTIK